MLTKVQWAWLLLNTSYEPSYYTVVLFWGEIPDFHPTVNDHFALGNLDFVQVHFSAIRRPCLPLQNPARTGGCTGEVS
jgi:hypothetical protein